MQISRSVLGLGFQRGGRGGRDYANERMQMMFTAFRRKVYVAMKVAASAWSLCEKQKTVKP